MCLPESAQAAEKTVKMLEIAMGQMLAEAGGWTAGSALLFASSRSMILTLVCGRVLKRYQRNALKRISSVSGRMIVIRPRWLEGTGTRKRARLAPQTVGCWRRRSGAGILDGRSRL